MSTGRIFLRSCLFLTATTLALWSVPGCKHGGPPAEEEHPEAPVQAQPAKKTVLGEWTDLFGTTQPLPNHSAKVSAAVEGHVLTVLGVGKKVPVVEGQQVKARQVIVQLDDSVVRANRDKARAIFRDLEAQHEQAQFAIKLAVIDVERLRGLQNNPTAGPFPLVSKVELDKAEVLHKDAESKLKSVAAKQAAAAADVEGLDRQLEFFALRAPIAGRLSMVQAVPGQTLTPGTVVADVLDLDPIDVLCYAPPDTAGKLKLDQPARLIVEETTSPEAGKPLAGKVAFIGVQAQPETGNVPVKVRFPNPNLQLRAHAVVRVYVLTRPEKERLTLPEAAVMEDLEIPAVIAVRDIKTEGKAGEEKQLGKARKLQVFLGVRDRKQGIVEVVRLEDPATKEAVAAAGLVFVTAGGHGLQNDDVVKIEKQAAKEAK